MTTLEVEDGLLLDRAGVETGSRKTKVLTRNKLCYEVLDRRIHDATITWDVWAFFVSWAVPH
jgi:hypothetical protein